MKKALTLMLALLLVLGMDLTALASAAPSSQEVSAEITELGKAAVTALDALTDSDLEAVFTGREDAPTSIYSISRSLILAVRSGADASAFTARYLDALKKAVPEGGAYAPLSPESSLSAITLALAATGNDPASYAGANFIELTEAALTAMTAYDTASSSPYYLPVMYQAVCACRSRMKDPDACVANIKKALLAFNDGVSGVNFYGTSVDNNGYTLSPMASLAAADPEVKALADLAASWIPTMKNENGTYNYSYKDWNTKETVTYESADSTAAALAFYAAYGSADEQAAAYRALAFIKEKNGGYFDYDNDALYGLLTYSRLSSGGTHPLDVTDLYAPKKASGPVDPSTYAIGAAAVVALVGGGAFIRKKVNG